MRRNRRWKLRMALSVMGMLALLWIVDRSRSQPVVRMPSTAVNLLVNTEFRKTLNDAPDNWFFDRSLTGKGSVRIVSDDLTAGRVSLCLDPTSRNNDPSKPLALAQLISPEPFLGHKLLLQASLKVSSGGAGSVHLFALSHGQPIAQTSLAETGAPKFVTKQGSITVPANTDELFFLVATGSRSGAACFGDLAVFDVSPDAPAAQRPQSRAATTQNSVAMPPVAVSPAAATVETPPPAEEAGRNLIKNADFRRRSGNFPNEWLLGNELAPKGSVRVENNGSRPGQLALCLTPNSRNSDKAKPFGLAQMMDARPYRGRRLVVHASIRVRNGGTGFVHLFALAAGAPVGEVTFTQASPTDSFAPQENILSVPNHADQLLFAVTINTETGAACFDDLFVGEAARARRAASPAPGIASVGASIRMNADRMVRRIPAGLYGSNIEWVRNGNTIWDSSTNQPRPEMIRRMKEAGTSFIRYPGGGLADHFHWRDSIGPMASRPIRPHVLDPESSKLIFGTGELMEICRRVGAEPLITVNITNGTSQEAADWVTYCNREQNPEREKNGSKAPYNVKYWEIGNEQYINNPASGLPNSYLRPQEYTRRFLEFAAAMKAADPRIMVGAVGGINFGSYHQLEDDNWNAQLLSKAADKIDFLSVHNGYAPVVGNNPLQFFDVYQAMMAFPPQLEANLAQLSGQLDSYGAASRKTKIAVTEWGPLFAADVKSPWVGHPKTLGSGLYVAGVLNAFLRSPRVEIATYLKVTENNYMGWLYPNGDTKPSFQVLQLYWQHMGSKLIETKVASGGFSSPAIGSVAAASNTPYLDAVASTNDAGSKLTFIVLNRDFNNAWSTSVQIDGFQPASTAKAWELTADTLDANNGEDLTPDPRLKFVAQSQAPNGGLYSDGRPGNVLPKERIVSGVSSTFSYAFSPRSVTVLELAAR